MRLWVATTNPGKIREFREVLAPLGIVVHGLDDAGERFEEPKEDAPTFEGNARIKALAYACALAAPCVAEDSGLEVDALGGAPGVYSARYAGELGSRAERDHANNLKLLAELARLGDVPRSARFVCAVCVADQHGRVLFEARGQYEGTIALQPRGTGGFGYDPVFFLPELGRTSAELSSEEKHAVSHRGKAVRALAAYLAELHT